MRVFFAIFIFSMFRIWSVEAAEPIVVLTYGESRESFGSMQDEYRTHPMRVDPNAHKTHKVQEAETLGHGINLMMSSSLVYSSQNFPSINLVEVSKSFL